MPTCDLSLTRSTKICVCVCVCTLQPSMRACQTHVQMAGHVMSWLQGLSASVPQGGMAQLVLKVRSLPHFIDSR